MTVTNCSSHASSYGPAQEAVTKPNLKSEEQILHAMKTAGAGGRFVARVAWRGQSNLRWHRSQRRPSVRPEARRAPLPPSRRPCRQGPPAPGGSGQDLSSLSDPDTTSDTQADL